MLSFKTAWLSVNNQHVGMFLIRKFTFMSAKKLQTKWFLCYLELISMSSLVIITDLRNETDYTTLDWNVYILEQRRNGIRSFVSQLLDFGAVGKELSKH